MKSSALFAALLGITALPSAPSPSTFAHSGCGQHGKGKAQAKASRKAKKDARKKQRR